MGSTTIGNRVGRSSSSYHQASRGYGLTRQGTGSLEERVVKGGGRVKDSFLNSTKFRLRWRVEVRWWASVQWWLRRLELGRVVGDDQQGATKFVSSL